MKLVPTRNMAAYLRKIAIDGYIKMFIRDSQKKYLEDYAVQHGFGNIQHFSDDGYSGTNFVEVR